MKKGTKTLLKIVAIAFIIVFAFFYKGTKGDILRSLTYSVFTVGGVLFATWVRPGYYSAKITSKVYDTDIATGAVIDRLEEQNRRLEEQNRILEEQNRNKR